MTRVLSLLSCCLLVACSADVTTTIVSEHVSPPEMVLPGAPSPDPGEPQCEGATWCVTTIAGGGADPGDGAALDSAIFGPSALAVDASGAVYFSERSTVHPIRVIRDGFIRTLAAEAKAFVDAPERFWLPDGLAIDHDGALLVAEWSHRIRRVEGDLVTNVVGVSPLPSASNTLPRGGLVDGPVAVAELNVPTGVAVDPEGNLAIADLGNMRIRWVEDGVVSTLLEMSTAPWGVAVSNGTVYATDQGGHAVIAIENGVVTTIAGGNGAGDDDGPAAAARFDTPHGIAVDDAGRVYVADWGNHRIRVIEDGEVSTLCGSVPGFGDGPAPKALFDLPTDVAVDAAGNVYVADRNNHRIRKISRLR